MLPAFTRMPLNPSYFSRLAVATLLTWTLAACGGGGSGSGDVGTPGTPAPAPSPSPAPAPSPLPVPAPAPTPIASTGSYREASVGIPVGPLTYLNSLGSEGFTPVRTWQVNSRGVMADAFMLGRRIEVEPFEDAA